MGIVKNFYCHSCKEKLGKGSLITLKVVCPNCDTLVIVGNTHADKTYGRQKLTVEQMHSSQSKAAAAGHGMYFPKKTCRKGHKAPRYTKSKSCVVCARLHASKYQNIKSRKYREHTEKLKKWYDIDDHTSGKSYGPANLFIGEMKITRQEALKEGHSHYFTGRGCKNGHVAPRTTGNATCVICTREHVKKTLARKKKRTL